MFEKLYQRFKTYQIGRELKQLERSLTETILEFPVTKDFYLESFLKNKGTKTRALSTKARRLNIEYSQRTDTNNHSVYPSIESLVDKTLKLISEEIEKRKQAQP